MKRKIILIVVCLILFSLVAPKIYDRLFGGRWKASIGAPGGLGSRYDPRREEAVDQTYTVEDVIEGNTIVVTTPEGKSEKIQLIGIDTPEINNNPKTRRDVERTGQDIEEIMAMGQEATEFVQPILPVGAEVHLEFDVTQRDKYGRLLAYVFVEVQAGSHPLTEKDIELLVLQREYELINNKPFLHLNAELINAGYAQPMTIPPNVKYADLFQELYEEAREEKRGLWSDKDSSAFPVEIKSSTFGAESYYSESDVKGYKVYRADKKEPLYTIGEGEKRGLWEEEKPSPVACTMDAKQCPDGSYVGRVAPDCKFKACPNEKEASKVKEGDACLQDEECKMMDCKEAIKKSQGCDFNKPICWNKECTCQFICI